MPEIRRLAQQILQGMSGRQHIERVDEIPDLLIAGGNADAFAEFLQHVNSGPSVRRIHHEVHRAIRLQNLAQSAEPRIRVSEMVENAGTYDLVECHPQTADLFDGKPVNLEILQIVFSFEFFSTSDTRCAEIDPDNLR